MNKIFAAIALATAFAMPAMAAEGIYMGADIGRSNLKIEGDASFNIPDFKDHGTTFSLFGGYKVNDNLALELGWRNYGKAEPKGSITANNVTTTWSSDTKATGFQASVLGMLPLNDQFSLLGRLGVANIRTKGTAVVKVGNNTVFADSGSDRETKAFFGLGARYAFDKQTGVRAEFQKVSNLDGARLSTFTVGVDHSF